MTPFRILIAHSRSFNDADLLKRKADYFLSNKPVHEVVMITQTGSLVPGYRKDKVFVSDWNSWAQQAPVKAYEEAVIYCDAVLVFWDGESFNEKELIRMCKEGVRRHVVVPFKSVKQEIEDAEKKEKKVKRKKITVPLTQESKQRYNEAHAKWYQRQYPQACKDGLYTPPKPFPINGGAAMDKFIVNFIVWEGWSATKVAVMLRRGDVFMRTGAKDGTFDVSATINSRSVKIDTKHSRDTASKEQIAMQERERRSGAIAEFVPSIESFFVLYDKIVNNQL